MTTDGRDLVDYDHPEHPVEARCDQCKQQRILFLYRPDCGLHLGATAFTCRWCSIEKQPLLCTPCWSKRKEAETMEKICANNARIAANRGKEQ